MRKIYGSIFIGIVTSFLLSCPLSDPVSEIFVVNVNPTASITVHASAAGGDTPPLRSISGGLTGLQDPSGIFVDTANGEVFVTNRRVGAPPGFVTVYARTASNNCAPLRTLTGSAASFEDPFGFAVDSLHDEIFVCDYATNSISVFDRNASGSAVPVRRIVGPATGLNAPIRILIDAGHDEIVVANSTGDSITVFARDADANAAPLRMLTGASTLLNDPCGLVFNEAADEIVVANLDSITVYDRAANGNIAPKRTIAGASTKLNSTWGMCLDRENGELFVLNDNSAGDFEILVFSPDADGDTPPLRILSGAAMGLADSRDVSFVR